MTKALENKIALVTGGSRSIGAAIVRRLAADGAKVAFTYSASADRARVLEAEIAASGGTALAIHADSADVEALQGAVAQTAKTFGRIDILVSNAGILLHGLVDDYDLEKFDRMVAVNVKAIFVATQAVLPHMGEGGRIITIGSMVADRSGFPGSSVYSMTKGAVQSLTRGLSRDLASRGITVNVVQPGPTDTDLNNDPDKHAMLIPMMPIGRLGKDSEVASLVSYLAGPESSFISGSAFTIDGGFTA